MAFRVPVTNVSCVDFTFVPENKPSDPFDIYRELKRASEEELKGVLGYTNDEVVS